MSRPGKGSTNHSRHRARIAELETLQSVDIHTAALRAASEKLVDEMREVRREIASLRTHLQHVRAQTIKAMTFVLELLQDPEAEHHAKAILRDHFITRPERKKNE